MPEAAFEWRPVGEDQSLPCWEARGGDTVVAILAAGERPTCAHRLLATDRRVIVFAMTEGAEAPGETARRIGAALAGSAVAHFDLMGEGTGAAAALWLGLMPEIEIGSILLAAPEGPLDEAFRAIKRPVLVLCGTKNAPDAVDRCRTLLPESHFMLVYDAGRAIGVDRPEALAFIAREFFERRDLFLVSRESGVVLP